MTVRSILESAFNSLNQCVTAVFLDLIWRSIWVGCGLIGLFSFWMVLVSRLGSLEWQGPELGATNPMMLLAALQGFWNLEGTFLVSVAVVLVLILIVLWVVLEALFRGGRRGFWIYLGTGVARMSILFIAAIFFLGLAGRDETQGTLLIGAATLLAMWFSFALLETVVRRDAVALMATDFLKVAGIVGIILSIEAFFAFLLWGATLLVLVKAGGEWVLPAALLTVLVLLVWMIVHSYLVAVRYSAIDIMRRNVVGS